MTTATRRADALQELKEDIDQELEDFVGSFAHHSVKKSVLEQVLQLVTNVSLTGFTDPAGLASKPILALGGGTSSAAPTSNPEADAALAMLTGLATDLGTTPADLMRNIPAMFQRIIQLNGAGKNSEAKALMTASADVLAGHYTVKPDGSIDTGGTAAELATAKSEAQTAKDALANEKDPTKSGTLANQLKAANDALATAKKDVVDATKPIIQLVANAKEKMIGDGRVVHPDKVQLDAAKAAVGL